MDGLTIAGVIVAIATGAIGTVLGIRSELRASRYSTLWVVKGGAPSHAFNRTGEDATHVEFKIERAKLRGGVLARALVLRDEDVQLYVEPDDPSDGFGLTIEWTRPATNIRYVYPRRHRGPRGSRAKRSRGTTS